MCVPQQQATWPPPPPTGPLPLTRASINSKYPLLKASAKQTVEEAEDRAQNILQQARLQLAGLGGKLLGPMAGDSAPRKYLVLTDLAFPREKSEHRAWLENEEALKMHPLANVSFQNKHAISDKLPRGIEPSLVVVLHIYPGTHYGRNRPWIEEADQHNMTTPQYAVHRIARHWPSSAILAQVRTYHINRGNPEFEKNGFVEFPPHWPSVNGFTYNPKRNDGSELGVKGDAILYRSSPVNPFRIADVERLDLQQLFRHAATPHPASGKQPLVLMYSSFDCSAARAIHMLITRNAD